MVRERHHQQAQPDGCKTEHSAMSKIVQNESIYQSYQSSRNPKEHEENRFTFYSTWDSDITLILPKIQEIEIALYSKDVT